MFKANIVNKALNSNGTISLQVEFTDGIKSFVESVTPQDEQGLTYFIEGRLKELNFAHTDIQIGEFTPPIPVIDNATKLKQEWWAKIGKLTRLNNLVSLGLFTADELGIAGLKTDIQTSFNADYLV